MNKKETATKAKRFLLALMVIMDCNIIAQSASCVQTRPWGQPQQTDLHRSCSESRLRYLHCARLSDQQLSRCSKTAGFGDYQSHEWYFSYHSPFPPKWVGDSITARFKPRLNTCPLPSTDIIYLQLYCGWILVYEK